MKTINISNYKTTLEITLKFEVSGMTEQQAKEYLSNKILSGQIALDFDENIELKDVSGVVNTSLKK